MGFYPLPHNIFDSSTNNKPSGLADSTNLDHGVTDYSARYPIVSQVRSSTLCVQRRDVCGDYRSRSMELAYGTCHLPGCTVPIEMVRNWVTADNCQELMIVSLRCETGAGFT